jgi:hypothetical protein
MIDNWETRAADDPPRNDMKTTTRYRRSVKLLDCTEGYHIAKTTSGPFPICKLSPSKHETHVSVPSYVWMDLIVLIMSIGESCDAGKFNSLPNQYLCAPCGNVECQLGRWINQDDEWVAELTNQTLVSAQCPAGICFRDRKCGSHRKPFASNPLWYIIQ